MFTPVLKAAVRQLPRLLLLTGAACSTVISSAYAQDPYAGEMIDGSVMLAPGEVLAEPYHDPSFGMMPSTSMGHGGVHHGHHAGGHGISHRHAPLTGGLVAGPISNDLCFGGCEPGYYVRAEALYMRRTGHEGLTLSEDFALDEFDFELGSRLTLGRLFDCVNGYEFVYTRLSDNWAQGALLADAASDIDTRMFWFDPLVADPLSSFDDAALQTQTYSVDYDSYEANRTYRGWDVVNLLIGGRVIDYREQYSYTSQSAAESGLLAVATDNLLIGGQVGIDLAYPLGQRVWSTIRGRAGLFANFADSQVGIVNNGVTIVDNDADDEDISGLLEFGTGVRYRVARSVWLTGGYEATYLHDVATAPDQLYTEVSSGLGISTRIDDEVFIHGLTLGAEVFF